MVGVNRKWRLGRNNLYCLWGLIEWILERVHPVTFHQAFIEHLVNTDREGSGGEDPSEKAVWGSGKK